MNHKGKYVLDAKQHRANDKAQNDTQEANNMRRLEEISTRSQKEFQMVRDSRRVPGKDLPSVLCRVFLSHDQRRH